MCMCVCVYLCGWVGVFVKDTKVGLVLAIIYQYECLF